MSILHLDGYCILEFGARDDPRICQALSRNVSNGQPHELGSTSVADSRPTDRWAGRGPCHHVGRMLACLEIHCRDEQTAIESPADLVASAVVELAIATKRGSDRV